jgi:hypothetical protein
MLSSLRPSGILCFSGDEMVGRRDEPLRIRLSPSDLDRVSAIQEYLDSIGEMNSLGKVVSNAIDAYYSILVCQGSVPPDL